MTPSPLVSIIVPCHFSQEDIRLAISSVDKQNYRPIEVIVIADDGDDYRELLADFATRMPLIFGSTNSISTGPSNADNIAMTLCHGEIILILDSDDFLDPDFLDRVVPRTLSEGACMTPRRPVDYTLHTPILTRGIRYLDEYKNRTKMTTREYMQLPFGWQTVYRRDMLTLPFETEFFLDAYLIMECRIFDRIGHVPFEFYQGYNYRVRSNSICHSEHSYSLAVREYRHMLVRLRDEKDGFNLLLSTRQDMIALLENRLSNIERFVRDKASNQLLYEPQIIGDLLMYPL